MKCTSLSPNIGVRNVNETVKFYTEQLGFQLIMSNPAEGELLWAMVGAGDVTMMFQEQNSLIEEYPELKNRGDGLLTFYVKVTGLIPLYKKLEGTDMIVKPLGKTFYGANEFAIRDNNGYVLTITEDE
jgi:uncharacterized glyoxalase superfamily protein PhnB